MRQWMRFVGNQGSSRQHRGDYGRSRMSQIVTPHLDRNPEFVGFRSRRNLLPPKLVERILTQGEGHLCPGGAISVRSGERTGRSPNDKFIVATPEVRDRVWWDENLAMEPSAFESLRADVEAYAASRTPYVQDLYACANPRYRLRVRVVTELAWHSLFIRHLLIRPPADELRSFLPHCTIYDFPGFRVNPEKYGCNSDAVIAIDLEQKIVVIAGTAYAGEMKKAVFSLLNYHLPIMGVMPMHCAANRKVGSLDQSAVFFGLSGTGKTTLSSDKGRELIGDDEHGWSDKGVFNFEGGCYAKTINLSSEAEPEIHAATRSFGTVLENMITDPATGEVDYTDSSITENMRAAYPVESIASIVPSGMAGPPRSVVMLTCDAYGVLPGLARLTTGQAIYHFLSGFTSKIPGTETGINEPKPTFSACFGQPFLPLAPAQYGRLLRQQINKFGAECWLLNTGWTGGGFGKGGRMPIQLTRALLRSALDGSLDRVHFRRDPNFGFLVPRYVPGIDADVLDPVACWDDPAHFQAAADELVGRFARNFERFSGVVDEATRQAAL